LYFPRAFFFQACLNQQLAPDEELDTDDLIGKRFEAMVSVKKTGKGNRTEHGTIGPHRPKKAQLQEVPRAEESDGVEEEFQKIANETRFTVCTTTNSNDRFEVTVLELSD
jgi:hypothetical protein